MNTPRLTVLIFTYRGDEGLTPICVEFAKETLGPDTKIVVADDGFNAMQRPMQEKLIAMGVDYRQTDWPRCGNLLGPDHLRGACKLMAELAKDCDIIVKLDPDACILKRDWIDRFWSDKHATITSSYKIKLNYPMGNSYALKSVVCEELAKDAELYPGWVDCFEDYEIGMRISRIAKGDVSHAIRHVCGLNGGFVLTNPWDINYKTCIESVQVYCSGFQYGSQPQNKKVEYKNKQIEVHTTLLSEFKKSCSVMKPIVEQNIPVSIDKSPLNNGNFPKLPQVSIETGPTNDNNQYMAAIDTSVMNTLEKCQNAASDKNTNTEESIKIINNGVKLNSSILDELSQDVKNKVIPDFLEDYTNA